MHRPVAQWGFGAGNEGNVQNRPLGLSGPHANYLGHSKIVSGAIWRRVWHPVYRVVTKQLSARSSCLKECMDKPALYSRLADNHLLATSDSTIRAAGSN